MSPVRPDEKRKWYSLALRHLRMASRLLRSGFADGAVFHMYHAYECVLSAMIAAQGYAVPPEGWTSLVTPAGTTVSAYPSPRGGIQDRSAHRARLVFFAELMDHAKPYATTQARLSRFMTVPMRNDTLYYDSVRDRLPYQSYTHAFAAGLLLQVRRFAREVWQDIR